MNSSATDTNSNATNGSSSNIIQNGSLIANVIMFAIVMVLLWRGGDTQLEKRIAEADRHHTEEIAILRSELNKYSQDMAARIEKSERIKRDHDNRVQQWEDYTYTHVNKLDALFAARGIKPPAHLSTPP